MGNERVHGPYDRGYGRKRWRVVIVSTAGKSRAISFETEREALAAIKEESASASDRYVSDGISAYLESKRERGIKESTLTTDRYRLRAILRQDEGDRGLATVTPAVAKSLYTRRSKETAGDTHIGELALANAMFAWLVDEQGWIARNPFEDVESTGKKRTRAATLRVDDARKFLKAALAYENSKAGTGAAVLLLMALRASEVTSRKVRDVDDGGRLLWIPDAKTPSGVRAMEVPLVLRERLVLLTVGQKAGDLLFGYTEHSHGQKPCDRHWLDHHVQRICTAAKIAPLTPHRLRSLHTSLARVNSVSAEAVARALGHASTKVTKRHYMAPGLEEDIAARHVEDVLTK